MALPCRYLPHSSVVDPARLEKAEMGKIIAALEEAAAGRLRNILTVVKQELVSSDFLGNPHSSIIDAPLTMVLEGNMVKAVSWYDNEWAYAARCGDLVAFLGEKGL